MTDLPPTADAARKRNWWMVALAAFGAFILVALLSDSFRPVPTVDGPPERPVKASPLSLPAGVVSATDLRAAFEANEISAKQRFGSGELRVGGIILAIEHDLMQKPIIRLSAGSGMDWVVIELADEAARAKAATLARGQTLIATCRSVRAVIGFPHLEGCRF